MSTGTVSRTDPLVACHFYVNDAEAAVFTEVAGLEVEVETTTYEEGGRNEYIHKLPGRVKVGDITLRNGITTNNELWKWFVKVLQGDFTRRHVTIVMVDQKKTIQQTWKFAYALPVKWTGPQLRADQSQAAIQSLQLTHKGLIITNP